MVQHKILTGSGILTIPAGVTSFTATERGLQIVTGYSPTVTLAPHMGGYTGDVSTPGSYGSVRFWGGNQMSPTPPDTVSQNPDGMWSVRNDQYSLSMNIAYTPIYSVLYSSITVPEYGSNTFGTSSSVRTYLLNGTVATQVSYSVPSGGYLKIEW
jgi:hypothetical protein